MTWNWTKLEFMPNCQPQVESVSFKFEPTLFHAWSTMIWMAAQIFETQRHNLQSVLGTQANTFYAHYIFLD